MKKMWLIVGIVVPILFIIMYAVTRLMAPPVEKQHWQKVFAKAFEPVDCPAPRDPSTLPDGYYKGPIIDTHIHLDSLPDGEPGNPLAFFPPEHIGTGRSLAEWICMMDVEGTKKVFAFFPVWQPIVEPSIELAKRAMEKYPDRFIPFIGTPENDGSPNGFPTVNAKALKEMLAVQPGLFKGYGEIGLYARQGGGAPALPPDSKRLTEIYPLVREHKLIVYFHLGDNQKEAFEKVLEANRDITFIWHGDQLIECEACPKNLDLIADILENHPNVYYGVDQIYGNTWLLRPEISKEEFMAHFSDYERLLAIDLYNWKGLIEKYPNQVLWGTDRGSLWTTDPDVALVLNDYARAFIGKLDPSVQEQFAYKNAEKLLSGVREHEIASIPGARLPDTIRHIHFETEEEIAR